MMKRLLVAFLAVCLLGGGVLYLFGEQIFSPFETLAVYEVSGGELVDEPASTEHQAVWDRFNELFPPDTHHDITQFRALDAVKSGGIDGALLAVDDDRAEWALALDTTNAYGESSLDRTMIHEFMHLVTLRIDQIPGGGASTCTTYAPPEGCPAEGSYLHDYFNEFWPGYTTEDYENETPGANGDCENECKDRFDTGGFVTDYAATIPTEDIAEHFAEWVLEESTTRGTSVQDQKFAFFDRYSELVNLREHARNALGG